MMGFRWFPTRVPVLAGVFLLSSGLCGAQVVAPDSVVLPPRDDIPGILTFLSPLLLPKVIQDEARLKEYIRSGELSADRGTYSDLYGVDLIFDRAVRLSWNNLFEALFISFVSVLDHDRFGIRLPIVGILLWFPLTSEFHEEYLERINALPRRLYSDSPRNAPGDRDKLQHFFGSALLAYLTESDNSAERIGNFIEWGEDKFIVDGVFDERDVRANRDGQRFGIGLLSTPDLRPSTILRADSLALGAVLPGRQGRISIPWEVQ